MPFRGSSFGAVDQLDLFATRGEISHALLVQMCSRLSRRWTARGSSAGFPMVGPAKVVVHKSFLFTDGSPVVFHMGNR